jgi:multicomponent Na+:H+ antiporter subunit G
MAMIAMILMVIGVFFFAMGTLGLWRFPDVYSRAHASTKCDTLGGGLILLALALKMGFTPAAFKFIVIVLLLWITNATAAHTIGRSAYKNKYPMREGSFTWKYQGGDEQ